MISDTYNKCKTLLNLDSTVFFSLAGKTWSVLKTPLTVFFITKYLSAVLQGYWYTFISLGALTVFAELGFTSIIIQYVSQEFAILNLNADNQLEGDQSRLERLASLIRFIIYRYSYIVPIGIIIVLIIGYVFFKETLYNSNLVHIWILYASSGGLTLIVSLLSSVLQGINKVKHVLQINLYANILSTVALWTVLMLGGQIWAIAIGNIILCIVSITLFLYSYKSFFHQVFTLPLINVYQWGKEMYKLQINYSISWIAGYFVFSFMTPVTMFFLGSVDAGKVGITLTTTSAILQMAHSWVANKMPDLNILFSLRKLDELKSRFTSLNRSSLFFFALFSLLLLGLLQLNIFDLKVKFLSGFLIFLIIVSEFAKLLLGNWAIYLRTSKTEPYVVVTVVNGILTVLIFVICLKFYKSLQMAIILYTFLQYLTLYWGYRVYSKGLND